MIDFKKIDWSYRSALRYVVDLHIYLVVILIYTYFFGEVPEHHKGVFMIMFMWLGFIGLWLALRLFDFMVDGKNKITLKIDDIRVTELLCYAETFGMSTNKIVDVALDEYMKQHPKKEEKKKCIN